MTMSVMSVLVTLQSTGKYAFILRMTHILYEVILVT